MDIQAVRRQRLREWIKDNHKSVVLQFAQTVGKPQSQMADMLDGRKSFGEKVARQLEKLARMPPLWLDMDPTGGGVREPTAAYHGIQLTRAGALLAAEWEKLDLADRVEIETMVLGRAAGKVRGGRHKSRRASHTDD